MITVTVRLSSEGQIVIPKEVLQTKRPQQHKRPAKSLRGFLQHTGTPISTEALCKPVEYSNDRF